MKHKHRPRAEAPRARNRCAQRGMTLIEIMVVISIIGMVSGIVAVSLFDQKVVEEERVTVIQLKTLSNALDMYSLRFRKYPQTREGLDALRKTPKKKAPIIREVPLDPWGQPYVYACPGVHNPDYFDLSSLGPDGEPNTADDITNWNDTHE